MVLFKRKYMILYKIHRKKVKNKEKIKHLTKKVNKL